MQKTWDVSISQPIQYDPVEEMQTDSLVRCLIVREADVPVNSVLDVLCGQVRDLVVHLLKLDEEAVDKVDPLLVSCSVAGLVGPEPSVASKRGRKGGR